MKIPSELKNMTSEDKLKARNLKFCRLTEELSELEIEIGSLGRIKEFIENLPSGYRFLHLRSMVDKFSFPVAIKAKCLDCSCWNKTEITSCETYTCPLWRCRPYQDKK